MDGLSLVIPALNEEAGIGRVLEEVKTFRAASSVPLEVIVVDDGSTDRTAEVARAHGAAVISHPINLGYGASIKRGMRQARYEWIGLIDADGTYAVQDLATQMAQADAYDMVVGARYGRAYHSSFFTVVMRLVFRWLCAYVTGRRVPDPNSGCRIFRKAIAVQHSNGLSQGFSFSTSVTMVYLLNGGLVGFVPIAYHQRIGTSKVRWLRDALRSSQILFEATLLYNPLKAFLLLGMVPFVLGLLFLREEAWVCALMTGVAFLIWSMGGLGVLLSRRHR